jgi:dGTPase
VYYSEPLVAERRRSAEAIAELFQFFLDHPEQLPEAYRDSRAPLHRTVCDYIAGMTDGYFRRVHQLLTVTPPEDV